MTSDRKILTVFADLIDPPLAQIEIHTDGSPIVFHNMPCSVCLKRSAVLYLNDGIFHPCRHCEENGWRLVIIPRWLQWMFRRPWE